MPMIVAADWMFFLSLKLALVRSQVSIASSIPVAASDTATLVTKARTKASGP